MQFTEPAPYASNAELRRRLGNIVAPPEYDLAREKFQVIVPEGYSTNSAWGLFVWISPGETPRLPSDWEGELAKHHLLFIGAYHSGNDRPVLDRFRLALDATCNMCRRFKVDRARIMVSGFSGGARMASVLGVAYGDLFTGTLCVCGVNFYRDVPATAGEVYPAQYQPDPRVLSLAKQKGRFILLTGEHDMNRANTRANLDHGFRPDGFNNVLYIEVPGMHHAMPDATVLEKSLTFLEGRSRPSP